MHFRRMKSYNSTAGFVPLANVFLSVILLFSTYNTNTHRWANYCVTHILNELKRYQKVAKKTALPQAAPAEWQRNQRHHQSQHNWNDE